MSHFRQPWAVIDLWVVVNIFTNRVVRVLGKDESVRFLDLALYQGAPAKKGLNTVVRRQAHYEAMHG